MTLFVCIKLLLYIFVASLRFKIQCLTFEMFAGTVCVLIGMPFMYSPCIGCEDFSQWQKLIYYGFFVTIFQFGWAAVQTAHLALVPDLSSDEMDRTGLLSIRFLFIHLSK